MRAFGSSFGREWTSVCRNETDFGEVVVVQETRLLIIPRLTSLKEAKRESEMQQKSWKGSSI
jgi:hypothetical protein